MFKTGHVSENHLKECGLAKGRIKNYIKDKLIEKVAYMQRGIANFAYKLTKKGRELSQKLWGLKNHYHIQSPMHDIEIANKYMSLPILTQETWKSEAEVRQMFDDLLIILERKGESLLVNVYKEMQGQGLISIPDALYTTIEGLQVSFEVITNNYGEAELQAKEAFVSIMKTQYETIRV